MRCTVSQPIFIHKRLLSAMYPEHARAIQLSAHNIDEKFTTSGLQEEFALVTEAWHLKSTPDSNDGRRVICTDKVTLVDEPYDKDYFPFTWFRWLPNVIGFYGVSLAERLVGNQVEINKMLRIIQKSFHLGSAFKVFLEFGSKVAKEHINNEIGSLVYYTGQKPEFYVPQTVHPEFFQHLNWLIKSSFEETGVSQLSATSKIPAGLESGVAIREYNDVETERFSVIAQNFEHTYLDTAKIYIDLSREMHEMGIDMQVVAESKRFIEKIKWSDTGLENNEYMMQMFPTSMLPAEPAGRLQFIQELVQAGYVSQDYAPSLLDFPDLQGYMSIKNAAVDNLLHTVDLLLYKGKYQPPEPFQNLTLGIPLMQSVYLRARADGAPESRLENLRRWISEADNMNQTAMQAQNPQAPQTPQQPQSGPPPTPAA